ncbi:hypothetical protein AOLI_G00244130 [Acnodon oligacanthus]
MNYGRGVRCRGASRHFIRNYFVDVLATVEAQGDQTNKVGITTTRPKTRLSNDFHEVFTSIVSDNNPAKSRVPPREKQASIFSESDGSLYLLSVLRRRRIPLSVSLIKEAVS